jgi:hypothetical protein
MFPEATPLPAGGRQPSGDGIRFRTRPPPSGEMSTIKEPLYKTELTQINETTDLLLVRDVLVEWKQRHTVNRSYN